MTQCNPDTVVSASPHEALRHRNRGLWYESKAEDINTINIFIHKKY